MNDELTTARWLASLRRLAILEGTSLLLLLVVGVPLKHLAGIPAPVRALGLLHGVLFILYLVRVIEAVVLRQWTLRDAGRALVAAVVPFGGYLLARRLQRPASK